MAWSVDWNKFGPKLIFAGHFGLYLLAVIVYVVHSVVTTLPPQWSTALAIIAGVLGTLGYGLGAAWSPPRRPWTNEERVANGLAPLPTVPVTAPVVAPLPPPVRPG